jgi:hypothetical protein
VASATTGTPTGSRTEPTPEVARRTWPGWLALGLAAVAVAVAALVWPAVGASLLLGASGAFLAGRGVVLLRGTEARGVGTASAVAGVAGLAVALVSAAAAASVLLVAVPLVLLLTSGALLARGRLSRLGGWVLLGWTAMLVALLVVRGVSGGWADAADLARVGGALAVAVLGVPMLVAAVNLRAVGRRPAPARPAACAGCACGAGGCGALG